MLVILLHGETLPSSPAELLRYWTTEASVVLPLLVGGVLYARGISRLWARAGPGRGIARWRAAAFAAGMLALTVALISPLDVLGEILFSAHMVQHLMLMLVAAPLLVMGAPERAVLWSFGASTRRRIGRVGALFRRWLGPLTRPGPAVAIATGGLWIWHVPTFYDLAVRNQVVHALEHATFLVTALIFWWSLLHLRTLRADAGNGLRLLALLAMVVQGSLLGALITFSATPLYAAHERIAEAWRLTPLLDQQLAGLIMWVPPAALYLSVAAHLMVRWLDSAESRGTRAVGLGPAAAPEAGPRDAERAPRAATPQK